MSLTQPQSCYPGYYRRAKVGQMEIILTKRTLAAASRQLFPVSNHSTACAGDACCVRDRVTAEEWELRVQLAAAYRVFAHLGWTHLIHTHITVKVRSHRQSLLILQGTDNKRN